MTFLQSLISPKATDYSTNSGYIFKRIFTWLTLLILAVILFLLFSLPACNRLNAILTFLLVAGASLAAGAAFGFLFGLPRAEKYRFEKRADADHRSREVSYGDNTNLEEVSDWLTKILVGLSLVKFRTIIQWMDQSARSINRSFNGCCPNGCPFNAYVVGYATMILFFLAGAGICYLWARTNLSLILTRSRIAQANEEKQRLVAKLQEVANPQMKAQADKRTSTIDSVLSMTESIREPSEGFRNLIESVYNAKPIYDATDPQRGRWGGKARQADFTLEAAYLGTTPIAGIYRVELSVRSLNPDNPLQGESAFFLHDSFPAQILYSASVNNRAQISFSAYEAFVAGARLQNGVELELDLNEAKGFPADFYWGLSR